MERALAQPAAERVSPPLRTKVGGGLTQLPRISKTLLFESVRAELNPSQADLERFHGHDYVRPKPRLTQKLTLETRKLIFDTAVRKAWELSTAYAKEECKESEEASEFDAPRMRAWARLFAAVYTWPEVFDTFRGFASQENAYTRTSMKRWDVDKTYHKGIDNALYELLEAGMTFSQVQVLTYNLLFNYVDEIKQSEPGKFIHFAPAGVFYRERIKPHLGDLKLGYSSKEKIDRGIMFLIYVGMQRESGDRSQEDHFKKEKAGQTTIGQLQIERLMDREDVQEGLGNETPSLFEQYDRLRKPIKEKEKKPINRFVQIKGRSFRPKLNEEGPLFETLRIESKANLEIAEVHAEGLKATVIETPEVTEPEPAALEPKVEEVERGWRYYVNSFFSKISAYFRRWFG